MVFRGSEMSETATHHEELDENFFRITVADMKSMFADRVKERLVYLFAPKSSYTRS